MLRTCQEDCLEAEVRALEATSDVEALKLRNIDITRQLAEEKRLKAEAEAEAAHAREAARRALDVCRQILEQDEGTREYYNDVSADITVEELERDIDAENARLDFMHGGNANAAKEFETRQVAIDKLEEKISDASKKLEKLTTKITNLREKWEPELDKLVKEISDAFAYNFEQISCAGEVGIHKDEDFDQWSIEIKVKFR
jgi:chromosome segregation ATPase